MKQWMKWGLAGFIGLAILGALFGEDPESGRADEASATTAEAAASARTPTPEPTPPPKPTVRLRIADRTVYSDAVTLSGRVVPRQAKVRVDGERVPVTGGRFSVPVTVDRGDNEFEITARAKGFESDDAVAVYDRELSSAERAAIRAARAAARANRRAVEAAENYLSFSGFSKQGLYEQLSSDAGEGFTAEEAQYAVDHVDVDWNEEAVESAENYLSFSPMSKSALIEQLTSSAGEGFTYEQAVYAADEVY